jgi:hypothetical protein
MAKLVDTSYDNQLFYEWDGLAEKWVVDEDKFDTDFPPVPQTGGTSLATHIIKDVFHLTLSTSDEVIGGYLPGYDVVNRGAYEIIQLSLVTELERDKLYECYAKGDGIVKYHLIGEDVSNIGGSVLYSFSQATWKQKCDNVLVFGYDPPEKRLVRGIDSYNGYNLFTLSNAVNQSDLGPEFEDKDLGISAYPKYWVHGDYVNYEACPRYREGYIEYSNVALGNNKYLNELGVYKYYEFEQIDGYMYKIKVPFFEQGSTQVEFRQKSFRYNELKGFGTLMIKEWQSNLLYTPAICNEGKVVEGVGIILPRSSEKKFAGVNAVYVIGYTLKQIECDEIVDPSTFVSSRGPATFIVDVDSTKTEPFKLNEGEDYLVIKEPGDSNGYRIVFSCNVNPNYVSRYKTNPGFGGSFDSPCTYRIARTSIYKLKTLGDGTVVPDLPDCTGGKYDINTCKGVLRDGVTVADDHKVLEDLIFPTGEGNTGYVVKKIIVVYEWWKCRFIL